MNPGTRLGAYVLEAELGAGGMGVVYRAHDARLGRAVALKLLPPTTDEERLARFEREARILAALSHPNIAGIHTLEEADGQRFLTMELVKGTTLAAALDKGALPLAEALDACRQVALALEAAHDAGVVHRDLKPGNVMLAPDGQVKVLDFGLARIDDPAENEASIHTVAATRAGIVLGTAAYMSPEQARGRPLDRRTDLWSFGCVLYECLTGRQAFPGETVSDSIAKILERDPDWGALPASVPERVVELVRRCLEKDVRQRLRDAGEARWTLEQALARRTDSGTIPVAPPPPRPAARSWPRLALVGVPLLLAGAALGAFVAGRGALPRLRCLSVAVPAGSTGRGSILLPDGSGITMAVAMREGPDAGRTRLLYRPIGSYDFRPIPNSEGMINSYLSPDGRRLLVLQLAAPGSSQRRLVALALDGATPPAPFADWNDAWLGFTWLANGDGIALDSPMSFVRLAHDGGQPSASRPITVEGGERVSSIELPPATFPDPGRILVNVVVYDTRGWHYSVGLLDLASGRVRRVVDDGGNAMYAAKDDVLLFARGRTVFAARFDRSKGAVRGTPVPVWTGLRTNLEARPAFFRVTDDGTLYYSPGGTGEGRVLALADSTGVKETLAIDPRNYDDAPQLAPDRRRFVVTAANARGIDELWTGAIGSSDLRKLRTDPDADCTQPYWSPDGTRIAYKRTGKDGRDGIYVVGLDGGEPRCVLRAAASDTTFRPAGWFADGSALLLGRSTKGKDDLVRLPVAGDPADRARLVPFAPGAFNRKFPRMSPDGRAVLFLGDDSGRYEFSVMPIGADGTAGAAIALSSGGSNAGLWGPDSRTLFANDTRNRVIEYAYPPKGTGRVALDLDGLDLASWTPLGSGRFLVRPRSGDESAITSYQLVQGWMAEVKRKL
jgi:sugar lactone lactonase YvrE